MHDSWNETRAQGEGDSRSFAVALGACALAVSASRSCCLRPTARRSAPRSRRWSSASSSSGERDERLTNRLGSAEETLERRERGAAGLAASTLRSVFTVEADHGFGTGFVAWADGSSTYVLTAHHVVAGTLARNGDAEAQELWLAG